MVLMNESMNASIRINMGNSPRDVSHRWIRHKFLLESCSWSSSWFSCLADN